MGTHKELWEEVLDVMQVYRMFRHPSNAKEGELVGSFYRCMIYDGDMKELAKPHEVRELAKTLRG